MNASTPISGMDLQTARRSMLLYVCELRDAMMALNPNIINGMNDDEVARMIRDFDVMDKNIERLDDYIKMLQAKEDPHGEGDEEPSASQTGFAIEGRAPVGARVAKNSGAPSAQGSSPVTYTYQGTIIRIHDGDTFAVDLDMGCRIWQKNLDVRVNGINAPELATPEGQAALAFAETLIHVGDKVQLTSVSGKWYEKYGRLLATVRFGPAFDQDFGGLMVTNGHAVRYNALAEFDAPKGVM